MSALRREKKVINRAREKVVGGQYGDTYRTYPR